MCFVGRTTQANDIEPSKEFYTATHAGKPIVLDGGLSEWAGVPVLADPKFAIPKGSGASGTYVLFEPYSGGTWTGPDDQTSAVQVAWDADNVYFGFVVTDDYHENGANSPWNGDSVQLMIASADRTQQVALYNYALGGIEGAFGEVIVQHEAGPGGTEAVITRDPATKKTIYEIKLPAASLGLTRLAAGTKFGLGMAINDGDEATPGQRGWGGLGAHSIVFGKTPSETALVTLSDTGPGTDRVFLSAINPGIDTFTFRATDKGNSIVAPATAKLTIDGQPATPLTSKKAGDATDFTYMPATPFRAGVEHSYSIEVRDTLGNPVSDSGTFRTISYALLTAADKVTADTAKAGFIWRVHQNTALQANDNVRPVLQLAGVLGENFADPAAQGAAIAPGVRGSDNRQPITFEIESVINLDQEAGSNGDFQPDEQMPGIPGSSTDGIAGEITTYIELPAGKHTFIVNSDDGFKTTAGNVNDIFRAQTAGEFSGGRGAADTAYTIFVQDAGVYAFRTVWQEGGGGANIEWKTQNADGTKVLINDRAGGGFKAYRSASGLSTGIRTAIPLPGSTGVAGDSSVQVTIVEGTDTVDLNSVKLSVNGAAANAQPTKSGNLISLSFKPAALFPPRSTNSASIAYTAGGVARTESWSFVVAAYGLLTPDLKVTADTSKPGFIWNVHQNPAFQANNNSRPLQQLAGLLGQNFADPSAQGAAIAAGTPGANNRLPVRFEIATVINLDQEGGSNGEFQPDEQMPGIPGTSESGPTDGIAGEILTFIELPAGKNTLVLNSDDGFRTSAGNINDVIQAQVLGEFSGGRGAADTVYDFFVEQAGVYPFRTVWQEGGGGANIEWKYVKPDGTRVLINDTANGGPKAYRAVTSASPAPAITSVTPVLNGTKVVPGTPIEAVIQENSVAVDRASIQLSVDGTPVTPTVTANGKVITVSHQPAAPLEKGAAHSVKLRFTYGGTERIAEWSFRVPPTTLDKVRGYPGLIIGAAGFSADKGGRSAQAGDLAIDLGRAGAVTPSVLIPDASFLNATAADDLMTFSLWIKKYDNANSSAFWADSPSSPSGQRGFQAHTPWSDNNVYFDTAGCCAGDATRISAGISTFAGFTDPTWWTDSWHHWAFIKNGATKQIYIDGQLFLEGGGTTPLPTDFARIWLGAEGGGDSAGVANNMHGLIDDFAVFGTALTQAQVQQLSSGTSPTALPATTKTLAFWDFNDKPTDVGQPKISVSLNGANLTITWTNGGTLQGATAVAGATWSDLDSDGSYTTTVSGGAMFFRVKK